MAPLPEVELASLALAQARADCADRVLAKLINQASRARPVTLSPPPKVLKGTWSTCAMVWLDIHNHGIHLGYKLSLAKLTLYHFI